MIPVFRFVENYKERKKKSFFKKKKKKQYFNPVSLLQKRNFYINKYTVNVGWKKTNAG